MRNLFWGVIVGLLLVVRSTPLHPVTPDDVYREAVTDGYLVDHRFLTSLTTRFPKVNTTVPASPPASSMTQQRALIEGSGSGDDLVTFMLPQDGVQHLTTTTQTASPDLSSPPAVFPPNERDGSGSGESGSGQEGSGYVPDPSRSWLPPVLTSRTNRPPSTSTASTETSPSLFDGPEGSTSGLGLDSELTEAASSNDHMVFALPDDTVSNQLKVATLDAVTPTSKPDESTPGWIVIVAFIACLAGLVMLLVAIATRHKWNRANPSAQLQTTADQQRALEMETFLIREPPMENGKGGEYTVIPLEELPEKYASH
ncbi:uncharacterized protein [Antennarius striatus]|uniref:uncharacterized protein n=1 Tax=Antennarius striatus TaxID=241820 RepID=UPI0035B43C55